MKGSGYGERVRTGGSAGSDGRKRRGRRFDAMAEAGTKRDRGGRTTMEGGVADAEGISQRPRLGDIGANGGGEGGGGGGGGGGSAVCSRVEWLEAQEGNLNTESAGGCGGGGGYEQRRNLVSNYDDRTPAYQAGRGTVNEAELRGEPGGRGRGRGREEREGSFARLLAGEADAHDPPSLRSYAGKTLVEASSDGGVGTWEESREVGRTGALMYSQPQIPMSNLAHTIH
ncbi:hypothetical protein CBR_g68544, partial [Chara braunii]